MTKSYFKQCDFCKAKIEMSDKSGNWLSYNLDNGVHDCRKDRKEITVIKLLDKLDSIGIKLDLDKLMNQ